MEELDLDERRKRLDRLRDVEGNVKQGRRRTRATQHSQWNESQGQKRQVVTHKPDSIPDPPWSHVSEPSTSTRDPDQWGNPRNAFRHPVTYRDAGNHASTSSDSGYGDWYDATERKVSTGDNVVNSDDETSPESGEEWENIPLNIRKERAKQAENTGTQVDNGEVSDRFDMDDLTDLMSRLTTGNGVLNLRTALCLREGRQVQISSNHWRLIQPRWFTGLNQKNMSSRFRN